MVNCLLLITPWSWKNRWKHNLLLSVHVSSENNIGHMTPSWLIQLPVLLQVDTVLIFSVFPFSVQCSKIQNGCRWSSYCRVWCRLFQGTYKFIFSLLHWIIMRLYPLVICQSLLCLPLVSRHITQNVSPLFVIY